MSQFTLSWDSYQQNICNGLGAFQQNEDFVDMTLAADGHFVRVHQLVLSLASPYLKDLIKSGQCQNPVILLNKISYNTLCYILEYIYTGQVVVAKENIDELIEAAKALHIKGLMDMEYQVTLTENSISTGHTSRLPQQTSVGDLVDDTHDNSQTGMDDRDDDSMDGLNVEESILPHIVKVDSTSSNSNKTENVPLKPDVTNVIKNIGKPDPPIQIQYSVSNQGNLQMILNRFIYYLRYNTKTGHRQWRCVDYVKTRCPAAVTTKDNIVLRRTSAHIHPFHDKRITKKFKNNAIFSVVTEAEKEGDLMKTKKT